MFLIPLLSRKTNQIGSILSSPNRPHQMLTIGLSREQIGRRILRISGLSCAIPLNQNSN